MRFPHGSGHHGRFLGLYKGSHIEHTAVLRVNGYPICENINVSRYAAPTHQCDSPALVTTEFSSLKCSMQQNGYSQVLGLAAEAPTPLSPPFGISTALATYLCQVSLGIRAEGPNPKSYN